MDKAFAIRKAGSQRKLADLLGISPQAVSLWRDKVPELQVYRLREMKPRWAAEWKRSQVVADSAAPLGGPEAQAVAG